MAHYFIFPNVDSTLYNDAPTENAGIDEILELYKLYVDASASYHSRIVMKFDLTDFSESMASGELSGSDQKYYLNLTTTEAYEIPLDYTVYVYPLSASWEQGTGRRRNLPITTDGVSYKFRDGVTKWETVATASDTGSGGKWYTGTGFEATQSFSNTTTDLHVDVTSIVNKWLSGSIPNHGFIIKHSASVEADSNNYGTINFFSNETHTIYRPRLEVTFKDYIFSPPTTWSLSEVTASTTWLSSSFTSFQTRTHYTGGLSAAWVQSASSNLYISESYTTEVSQTLFFLSDKGLYWSQSVVASTSQSFTFTSGSDTKISSSILTYATASTFYTAAVGAEFVQSASSTTYEWRPAVTHSNTYTLDTASGVYSSASSYRTASTFTYTSSSITGYTSSSVNQYTLVKLVDDPVITVKNLRKEYLQNTKIKFRIGARERYPRKTYSTGSWNWISNKYLPTSSFYSIRDAYTEEEIVPFSNYSQISADVSSSYFNMWLTGIEPERYYRILIKIEDGGISDVFDNDYRFRIIR